MRQDWWLLYLQIVKDFNVMRIGVLGYLSHHRHEKIISQQITRRIQETVQCFV